MSQVIETHCDVCGAQKGFTNHWYIVWTTERAVHIAPAETDTIDVTKLRIQLTVLDICGDSCLPKKVLELANGFQRP